MLSKDKNTLYACTTSELYNISKYKKSETTKTWEKIMDLPRFKNDENEIILQLKLDRTDQFLFGEYSKLDSYKKSSLHLAKESIGF